MHICPDGAFMANPAEATAHLPADQKGKPSPIMAAGLSGIHKFVLVESADAGFAQAAQALSNQERITKYALSELASNLNKSVTSYCIHRLDVMIRA